MKNKTSINQVKIIKQLSAGKYSMLDTMAFEPLSFDNSSINQITKLTGINKRSAIVLGEFRKKYKSIPLNKIPFRLFFDEKNSERLKRCLLYENDNRTIITNVEPKDEKIMSEKKFTLRVSFTGVNSNYPLLISVLVNWKGNPFTVEKLISKEKGINEYADIEFDIEQTLPVGQAIFYITLYNSKGNQSSFRKTCYVLPSNPFSLDLSPNSNFVTGTFSARAVKQGGNYITAIHTTLSNGNSFVVNMNTSFVWKFWDGGVGGSLIENGSGNFGGTIQVPAFGTWGGWISFNSPPGSGIFNLFNGKEDMTIEIIMTKTDGTSVSGTITARTMFKFGVNLTQVSPRDFVDQQNSDLQNAISVTRSVYERRDISFDIDNRFIPDDQVGGFEVIDNFDEPRDLWEQWSGPNTNNNIDAFITHVWIDGQYDGMDGDIPGPTSHDGRSSGVVSDKAASVDSSGHQRLHIDYLGMLIGHELGHYLGLQHVDLAGNLMLPSSGTNDTDLTYDQYKTMIQHGWVSID